MNYFTNMSFLSCIVMYNQNLTYPCSSDCQRDTYAEPDPCTKGTSRGSSEQDDHEGAKRIPNTPAKPQSAHTASSAGATAKVVAAAAAETAAGNTQTATESSKPAAICPCGCYSSFFKFTASQSEGPTNRLTAATLEAPSTTVCRTSCYKPFGSRSGSNRFSSSLSITDHSRGGCLMVYFNLKKSLSSSRW